MVPYSIILAYYFMLSFDASIVLFFTVLDMNTYNVIAANVMENWGR